MSRFFRSADSTSSSNSDSGDENDSNNDDDLTEELSHLHPNESPEATAANAVDRQPAPAAGEWSNYHRNALMHALLEDRCLNEALQSFQTKYGRRPSRDSPEVRAEANAKYQRLCARLASYDLISTGLEGDQHSITRQRYRDGLDVLGQQKSNGAALPPLRRLLTESDANGIEQAYQDNDLMPTNRPTVPMPLHRLLPAAQPDGEYHSMQLSHAFSSTLTQYSLTPPGTNVRSRYHQEFEELNMLGRGGYGIVYHARNRLDNQEYAIKKVPLSTSRLQRIQDHGEVEVNEVLKEIRTLSRLDHPNIVRYYAGWIEMVDSIAPSGFGSRVFSNGSVNVGSGAEDSRASLGRVETESSQEEDGIVFEASGATSHGHVSERSATNIDSKAQTNFQLRRTATKSSSASGTISTVESVERDLIEPSDSFNLSTASGIQINKPTLALHMQMSLHPMTLADFLSPPSHPPTTESQAAPPLSHCFHLETSIKILLAVLKGIEYLHSEGIVHRDIKPANIFLSSSTNSHSSSSAIDLGSCSSCTTEGNTPSAIRLEVRIGDFGLVTVANPEATALTEEEAVGTEIYRPNNVQGQGRHPSLDLYALGIVAFELLQKFSTKMERLEALKGLKEGVFSENFCDMLDEGTGRGERMKECIGLMLRSGTEISEVRARLKGLL